MPDAIWRLPSTLNQLKCNRSSSPANAPYGFWVSHEGKREAGLFIELIPPKDSSRKFDLLLESRYILVGYVADRCRTVHTLIGNVRQTFCCLERRIALPIRYALS